MMTMKIVFKPEDVIKLDLKVYVSGR